MHRTIMRAKEITYGSMEAKFNFNSAICTTREQSQRLIALGLKKETGDTRKCIIPTATERI